MIAPPKPAKSAHRFVARQPIFDRRQEVFGYELLFRSSAENVFPIHDGDVASSSLIKDTLLLFGLDSLIGEKKAFINVTRRMLVSNWISVLPRERSVIEILETIEPDEEVIAAVRNLKAQGYLLALDDFAYRPEYEALLQLADIVKVDFLATPAEQRRILQQHFAPHAVRLLAEKVETHEDFQDALRLGYSYFQGYFFCKPQMITRTEVPGLRANYMQLLHLVNRGDTDFDEMENIIKRDVSFSLKLLHYLNSANFGWRNRISSIKQALVLLGSTNVRKWASILAFSSFCEATSKELLTTSLCRAHFCELLAPLARLSARQFELFLTGLLSGLDVAMGRPLTEVLAGMSLSPDIHAALLGAASPLGDVYQLVLAYERGNWAEVVDRAGRLGISCEDVTRLYCQSVEWADAVNSQGPKY